MYLRRIDLYYIQLETWLDVVNAGGRITTFVIGAILARLRNYENIGEKLIRFLRPLLPLAHIYIYI